MGLICLILFIFSAIVLGFAQLTRPKRSDPIGKMQERWQQYVYDRLLKSKDSQPH